ncbi:MAG: ATP-binding cassette domain-containing protein [Chloroflexi bacterium]|nr:ATP-binding cassette domain-containing protein [Chloroflexota bacterium]
MNAVELETVSKSFGSVLAVAQLSLQVPEGTIYGFIGPNGSGKTTTLRVLLNIFKPDTGAVRLFGRPSLGARDPRLGYLPEERGLYRRMSVRELLCFFGRLKTGRLLEREVDTWLERFSLREWGGKKVETLSKGMAQKVQFIVLCGSRVRPPRRSPMRRALCIAKREYVASVKTKGFIIGLLLAPLLMCGGLIAVVALRGQVDVRDKRMAIIDRSGLLTNALFQAAEQLNAQEVHAKTGKKVKPAYLFVQLGAVGYFPFHLLPWFLTYVVLSILMVGGNSLALGAACNDARDAQNLALPALLPMMIPMFLLGPVLKEPHSLMATVGSFIPPFTPMLMLLRQSLPAGVLAWQPWLGLLEMLLFSVLLTVAAARVFRVGLLMQGKPPRLGELVRWALRG